MSLAHCKWRQIAFLMKQAVARGEYSLHDRLPPERVLSELYGVTRGTVRKALMHLEQQGIVETRPNSGTYVIDISANDEFSIVDVASPLELMETRMAFEPYACRLAVLHGRPQDFEKIGLLCDSMESCGPDIERYATLDTDFHSAVAECTHNGLLVWIVHQLGEIRKSEEWMLMRLQTLNADTIQIYNEQHRNILNAIRSRRADEAADNMLAHLDSTRKSLVQLDRPRVVQPPANATALAAGFREQAED